MEQRFEALQARLEEFARELKDVQRRLETLEARAGEFTRPAATVPRARITPAAADKGSREPELVIPAATVPLVGRTLMVLAGAYLVRVITPLTDTALVPALGGAIAGIAYGLVWLVQAERSAAAGQRQSAVFHGFSSAMITYPLIWETTARFSLFPTAAAACALVALLALGLVVASRRELGEVAWTQTLFTLATVTSLLIGTRDLMPLTAALLMSAVAVELVAFRDRWLGLRWPVAFGLDMAVLLMVVIAVRPSGLPEGYPPLSAVGVIMIGLTIPVLYLGSVGARSLLLERPVTPFEVLQVGTALLVGFGGAVKVITFHGGTSMPVAVASLLLGMACYAVAFAFVDRRVGRGRNFYCYTTFAGLLTLVGSYMVLSGGAVVLCWAALAVAAVSLGGGFDRITLKFHGAVYLGAAAVAAGLISCAADGLAADWLGSWRPVTPLGSAIALTVAGCYAILVVTDKKRALQGLRLLPRAIVAAVGVWLSAGLAARLLLAVLAAAPGPGADGAFVAAGRTAVLAITAMALAWAGRRWFLDELRWLVYPVLLGGGIRLVLEDLRYGRPLTLFLAFALYGGALIVIPRLMKRES